MTALNAELDKGIKEGKIAPASRSFYESTVKTSEDLENLKEFNKSAPRVVGTNSEVPDGEPNGDQVALNAEQEAIADQMGLTEEQKKDFFKEGDEK